MFRRKDVKIFNVPDWSDTTTKTYDLTTVAGREQVPINLDEIKDICFIYVRENNEYYRLISDTTSGTTRTLVFDGSNTITITKTSTTMTVEFSGIGSSSIQDNSITTTKLATNSVTSDKIQNGSVTLNKIANGIIEYVTPEMYGAVGDGVADDSNAIQNAFDSGKNIICNGTYRLTKPIEFGSGTGSIKGYGKKRVISGRGSHLYKYNSGTIEMLLTDATFVLDGGYFHPNYVAQTTFRDCVFMGTQTTPYTEKAFYKTSEESVSHLLIYTCTFLNFDKAINFEHGSIWSGENEIKGCFFGNCNYCLHNQRLVDSYVCENIIHSSCQHAFYGIGGGTFFNGNHDYSYGGSLATGGYIIGNYFDGFNLLTIGLNNSIGNMIITNNYFLYNSKIVDVEQGAINVATSLVNSVICDNVVRCVEESNSLKFSLIKMLSSTGYCQNNVINNNQFPHNGHSIISTLDIGSTLYHANQCNSPMLINVTPLDNSKTTYKIFDNGNETTVVFTLTSNVIGELIAIDFGDANATAITGEADYDVFNNTTGELLFRRLSFVKTVTIYANELNEVDYGTDGIKVIGKIVFHKSINQTNNRQNYARLRV